ncbi:MAG TPA: hypothetical protein PKC30_02315 [Saprospiraceae bacterium]|nr:hypothetical protein [Saprospiraceae bacterium]
MIFLLLTQIFSHVICLHNYHVSNCDIKYNQHTQSIQISLHVFIDDIEDALRLTGADHLFILSEKETQEAHFHLEEYFNRHLHIFIDGQRAVLDFLGKESSGDYMAAWCYFEIYNIVNPKEIEVVNTLLLEVFDDQKNIVTIRKNQQKKSFLLFNHKKFKEKISLI